MNSTVFDYESNEAKLLNTMSKSLDNLKANSEETNQVLKNQLTELEDVRIVMEEDIEHIEIANKKLNELNKKSNKGRYLCILVLGIVVVILFAAVVLF